MRHVLRLLLIATALFALTGCTYTFHGSTYDPPQAAAELSGINWDGAPFNLADLRGKAALVFFGYTNCPDVCPTTLAEMRVLHEKAGALADKIAIVFVSVDPERDTVERLAEYIPAFSDRFYGVRVAPVPLAEVMQNWQIVAEKRYYEGQESATKYSVDHTARVFLVGPQGNLRASYAYGTTTADILPDVRYVLR